MEDSLCAVKGNIKVIQITRTKLFFDTGKIQRRCLSIKRLTSTVFDKQIPVLSIDYLQLQ